MFVETYCCIVTDPIRTPYWSRSAPALTATACFGGIFRFWSVGCVGEIWQVWVEWSQKGIKLRHFSRVNPAATARKMSLNTSSCDTPQMSTITTTRKNWLWLSECVSEAPNDGGNSWVFITLQASNTLDWHGEQTWLCCTSLLPREQPGGSSRWRWRGGGGERWEAQSPTACLICIKSQSRFLCCLFYFLYWPVAIRDLL